MDKHEIKKKAFSGAFWKFAERIIAQTVSLIVSIILARLLDPTDYGVVSIVTIFFTFANVIISGGLNTALIQKKDSDVDDYSTTLYVSIIVSLVAYGVLFFSAPYIAQLYNENSLIMIIRVMGLSLPITAVKSIVCAYTSSNLQFRKFFFATIGGTLFSAVVGIIMATKGCGPWALVAQQMTNTTIDTIILLIATKMPIVLRFKFDRFKSLFSYGWKILVASLITTIYDEINPLIVGIKYSSADLSFYTKGKTFPKYLSHSMNETISAVLFPVMAKFQDDKEALRNYTRRFIKTSSFIVFPLMLGFLAVSDNFVRVILTEKWLEAAIYIKIFCVAHMFNTLCTGNLETIRAMGRSDIILKTEIIKKTMYFITILLFVLFSKSPIVLAISSIVTVFIGVVVNAYPNSSLIDYKLHNQILDILPNLVTSIVMSVVVYLMNYIKLNALILLLCQILAGVLIYTVENLLIRNESILYIIGLLKNNLLRRWRA